MNALIVVGIITVIALSIFVSYIESKIAERERKELLRKIDKHTLDNKDNE